MIKKIKDALFIELPIKLRKKVVKNCFHVKDPIFGRALLYYKTDSYYSPRLAKKSIHTNDAEIIYILECLNEMGFIVDLIDRQATWSQISSLKNYSYQLIVSNCAGNSSPFHEKIVANFKYEKLIAYAMGPEPVLSTQLVAKRHEEFKARTGLSPVVRRLVRGSKELLTERFLKANAIIVNGNTFCMESYKKFYKPLFFVPSAIAKSLKFSHSDIYEKDKKTFLYFGGNGLICKGLDLVLEAFDGLKDLNLHVCGPSGETDFWQYYAPLLERNPQIKYHGFVDVGGKKFKDIINKAAFNIFTSCSEGCATSVLTCMRGGVIPILNFESGLFVADFGVEIPSHSLSPKGIAVIVKRTSQMSDNEVRSRAQKTLLASFSYTESAFKYRFKNAIVNTIQI